MDVLAVLVAVALRAPAQQVPIVAPAGPPVSIRMARQPSNTAVAGRVLRLR